MEEIKAKLPQYLEEADTRHLLFLEEYFNLITSFYPKKDMKKDEQLLLIQEFCHQIHQVKLVDQKMLAYVSNAFTKMMERNGWRAERQSATSDNWYYPTAKSCEGLKFWIHINRLKDHNIIEGCLELYEAENTRYGVEMRTFINEKGWLKDGLHPATKGKINGGFYQLIYFYFPVGDFTVLGFEAQLEKSFKERFLKHENQYIEMISEKLIALKNTN